MTLTPEKKSEHIARKQEKQRKKIKMLEKKYEILISNGYNNRARDIKTQIFIIKGEMKNRAGD